ncbi:MAG: ferrochelatase [Deltaproteobacteria bacterium]|nr:ferrochelatase [Deltaproteobacteria bacterium]
MSSFGCANRSDKAGVLLAQLGTPAEPTARALRPYLKQFLSDRRVVEANRALWWVILNGIILRTRPKRSAALYKRIWQEEGSPLLLISNRQRDRLRERFRSQGIEVEVGMRYGSPSLEEGLDRLIAAGCARILLFPMYPQYSASTSASSYDAVFMHLLKQRWVPTLRVAEPYYRNSEYIDSLAAVINETLAKAETPQKLLLSYHGVPEAYVRKGDPYCCHCSETTQALISKINLPSENVMQTYQSRFGKDPWLTPYTDVTIEELGRSGFERIAVAAPGFTADCLETLDELGNEGGHAFKEAGGKELILIPCLNDHRRWIDAMERMIITELGSWYDQADVASNCITCPASIAVQS